MPAVIYEPKVVDSHLSPYGTPVAPDTHRKAMDTHPVSDQTTHPGQAVREGREDQENYVLARDLKGRAIVTVDTGEKLGSVAEILFHPDKLQIAGLEMSRGGLFDREIEVYPAQAVRVWGKDVILVDRAESLKRQAQGEIQRWIKLSDQLQGRYVVSTDGVRIGQINDLIIDQKGKVIAYDLAQVFVEGQLASTKRIPVQATSSLGKDVLIVDREKI